MKVSEGVQSDPRDRACRGRTRGRHGSNKNPQQLFERAEPAVHGFEHGWHVHALNQHTAPRGWRHEQVTFLIHRNHAATDTLCNSTQKKHQRP